MFLGSPNGSFKLEPYRSPPQCIIQVTVYIALEVGLNFSASIPISVLSITLFKYVGRCDRLKRAASIFHDDLPSVGLGQLVGNDPAYDIRWRPWAGRNDNSNDV